jgi:hypothetical protein
MPIQKGHEVFKLVVHAAGCRFFLIPQERAEFEQILAVDVFGVELVAGFGEVP